MRLKPSEISVAIAAFAFAALFLASNVSGLGYALVAANLLWVLTRVEILEDHDRPGHYTSARGRLGVLKLALLLGIYGAAAWGALLIKHDFGSKARATLVADFAIAGLCFMLLTELWRSADDTVNWFTGARAERLVGGRLANLKDQGWLVMHGYKKDWGGDIDHIACSRRGAYAIETKSYGYKARDAGQAAGNAAWLKEKLGIGWVTGVLCVEGHFEPWKKGTVWVVSHDDLLDWLPRQQNTPADPAAVRARLENSRDKVDSTGVNLANA